MLTNFEILRYKSNAFGDITIQFMLHHSNNSEGKNYSSEIFSKTKSNIVDFKIVKILKNLDLAFFFFEKNKLESKAVTRYHFLII